MADSRTFNYGWVIPADQASADTWGQKLNADLQAIDAQVFANTQPSNNVTVISSASVPATFSFYNSVAPSGQQIRWQWQMDTTAETDNNTTGSHLNLFAHDNTGALFPLPVLTMVRSGEVASSGPQGPNVTMTCNALVNFTQPVSFTSGQQIKVPSAVLYGPSTPILYFNSTALPPGSGGQGDITNVTWGQMSCSASVMQINGPPNGGGASLEFVTNYNGNQNALIVNNSDVGLIVTNNKYGGGQALISATEIAFTPASGASALIETMAGGGLQIVAGAGYQFTGANAFKAGGGAWGSISDARIKTVEGEYQSGLAEVIGLRPVTYRYNTGSDQSFIGLVAQEVEGVMPEMVTKGDGLVDGEKVDDLRTLDTTALIFALVNAVKALKAELDEVKALL